MTVSYRPHPSSLAGAARDINPLTRTLILTTYVLAAFAVLWPTYLVAPVAGANFSATRLLVLLTLGFCVVVCTLSPVTGQTMLRLLRRFWRFYLLFGLMFMWRLICDLSGVEPTRSIALTLIEMVGVFSIFVPMALVSASASVRRMLVIVIAFAALVAMLIGVYEALSGSNISARLAGRTAASAEIARSMMITQIRDGMYRIKAVFAHPILLSQFAGMILPLFIHLVLHSKGRLVRLAGLAGTILVPFVILKTVARSGILVAVLAVGVYFGLMLLARRKIRLGTLVVAALAGALAIGAVGVMTTTLEGLVQGRTAVEVSSGNSRTMMIRRGVDAVQESPIVGYGQGQSPFYAGLLGSNNLLTIDNYYLSAVLDFGIPGLALLLLLFLEILLIMTKAVRLAETPEERSLLAACGATCAVMFGQYVISSWDNLIFLFIAVGICMGAVIDFDRRSRRQWR
jgi:O-antigen ligase